MDNRDQLGKREITCFKAYDVRGELGKNLDADVAYRIGRAFAQARGAKRVVVGRDSRESSPELAAALIEGTILAGYRFERYRTRADDDPPPPALERLVLVTGGERREAVASEAGAAAVAHALGLSRRVVYHRAAAGQLPTFKIGGTLCAKRSDLDAWLAALSAPAPEVRP